MNVYKWLETPFKKDILLMKYHAAKDMKYTSTFQNIQMLRTSSGMTGVSKLKFRLEILLLFVFFLLLSSFTIASLSVTRSQRSFLCWAWNCTPMTFPLDDVAKYAASSPGNTRSSRFQAELVFQRRISDSSFSQRDLCANTLVLSVSGELSRSTLFPWRCITS